jgi:glycosyltransferase involved in cell wall biosynthesis
VLKQTIRDIEVIVVDDGSIDKTAEIVGQLAVLDSRVRLIQSKCNRGAQAARNIGARSANGDWLNFFDSDDWMLPTSIEARLNVARNQRVKIVHSEAFVLKPNKERSLYGMPPLCGYIYEALLRDPGPLFQGMIIAVDAFREMGELDEDVVAFQEWDTAIRLAKRHAFGFVPDPTFVYDCTGNDTITKNLIQNTMGYEYVVRKHRSEILRHLGPQAVSQHYAKIARYYGEAGALKLADKYELKSFLWWPGRTRIKAATRRLLLAKPTAVLKRSLNRIGYTLTKTDRY